MKASKRLISRARALSVIAAILGFSFNAGSVFAADNAQKESDAAFQQADPNHDGRIRKDEARVQSGRNENADAVDANRDGVRDAADFKAEMDGGAKIKE